MLATLALLPGAPSPAAERAPVRVLLAVLPFEIHSSQPLGYLEDSLAELLTTRLEASGRVRVLDAVVVREGLIAHVVGERTDAALRRLASELGADWVVAGSLTELARRYSVDVRVTPVATRLPSRTMILTAEGDEQLLGRVGELAERIVEIVGGEAPAGIVSEVRVEGAPQLGPDPPQLRTREGAPYDASALRADLDALRALPGIATASAQTERREDGVAVTFQLVPTERLLGTPEARPSVGKGRIAEVRVRGNRRIEANAIRARIATEAGDPYIAERIAADVREIYGLGFFRNVRVLREESAEGIVLTFEVEENPVIRQITITGNDSVDEERIRDALTLTTGSTLDYPLLYENRERVQAIFRAEGFYLARVSYEIEELPSDAVAIHFDVVEGKRLRLREISFEGNEHFTDDELRRGFQTKPWRFWSRVTRFFDRSGTYAEPIFLQDLQKVETRYLDAGYLQVDLDEPEVDASEEGLRVRVAIEEGKRFRVGEIDVEGDETVDLEVLREQLQLSEDEFFNRSHLTQDAESLTAHYTNRGFYFVNVNPKTKLAEDELEVDVTFEVEKGPLYFIREIEIEGNTRTIDPVIRREMQVVEGQLYSARALAISRARVERLGYFEEVTLEPKPTDYPEQLDVAMKVVEKPTGSLSFGAGFSSQDQLVLTGALSQSNLFGRGYGAQLSVDTGGRSDRVFLSFTDPYFMGSTFSLSSSIFRTDLEFEDFEQQSQGLDFSLGHALNLENTARGFARYTFADREIDQDENVNAASPIFRQVFQGEESTSLFGLSFRSDTRNDRVLPTEGMILGGLVDFAGLGGFSEFLRFEGRVSYFTRLPEWLPVPFRDRSTLNLSARSGWVLPFNDISDFDNPSPILGDPIASGCGGLDDQICELTVIDDDLELPLTERYFLGGLGTFQLRGYKARSVGPRRAILTRNVNFGSPSALGNNFTPVGRTTTDIIDATTMTVLIPAGGCADFAGLTIDTQGNQNGECNDIDDEDDDDFEDLDETDVIGGNKFLSMSVEYRFPISEALGLVGIAFFDMGDAFAENESLLDVGEWRYGTGLGVLWFSPFGPLQAFWGLPLDPLEVEDNSVFEFSVGGQSF